MKAELTTEIPIKPDELVVYELIQSTGLPLIAGGLVDQPHIWMMMWEVIDGTVKMFDHIERVADQRDEDSR